MTRPPARDKETHELIERFRAKRERRRQLRLLSACLIGAIMVALVVTAAVLAARGPSSPVGDIAGVTGDSTASAISATVTAESTTTSDNPTVTGDPDAAGASPATTARMTATTTTITATAASATTTLGSTTTSHPAASSTAAATSTTAIQPAGKVVVIDPGHQANGNSGTEPVGPGSSEMKAKVSSGTAGAATGIPESELVLAVSLKLRDALENYGIEVVMTRTTQNVDISNIQRAQIANKAGADLFVRIHADGSDESSTRGIHVLYPASVKGWTDDIATASKQAATLAQRELIAATGAKDRGIDARDDMTGFNWSDVPVILPEIGFMTNPDEDRLLATTAYQDKIIQGLTRAIVSFLGVD